MIPFDLQREEIKSKILIRKRYFLKQFYVVRSCSDRSARLMVSKRFGRTECVLNISGDNGRGEV